MFRQDLKRRSEQYSKVSIFKDKKIKARIELKNIKHQDFLINRKDIQEDEKSTKNTLISKFNS